MVQLLFILTLEYEWLSVAHVEVSVSQLQPPTCKVWTLCCAELTGSKSTHQRQRRTHVQGNTYSTSKQSSLVQLGYGKGQSWRWQKVLKPWANNKSYSRHMNTEVILWQVIQIISISLLLLCTLILLTVQKSTVSVKCLCHLEYVKNLKYRKHRTTQWYLVLIWTLCQGQRPLLHWNFRDPRGLKSYFEVAMSFIEPTLKATQLQLNAKTQHWRRKGAKRQK